MTETHRLVAAMIDPKRAKGDQTYRYVLLGSGLDWHEAQRRWNVLDEERRAKNVPGLVYAAVRADDDPDPRWHDAKRAPMAMGRVGKPNPQFRDVRLTDAERLSKYAGRLIRGECIDCGQRIWISGIAVGSHTRGRYHSEALRARWAAQAAERMARSER